MAVNGKQNASNSVRHPRANLPQVWLDLLHQRHPERPPKLHRLDVFTYCFLACRRQRLQPSPDRLGSRVCPEEDNVQSDIPDIHSVASVPQTVQMSSEIFYLSAEHYPVISIPLSRHHSRMASSPLAFSKSYHSWRSVPPQNPIRTTIENIARRKRVQPA